MRKTKIVATIGPATEDYQQIVNMINAGVDVIRFNMKHNAIEWHSNLLELVEKASKETNTRVATLIDLQGPEIRIDKVPDEYLTIESGDTVRFCKPGGKGVELDHPEVFADVVKGQTIYADDGFLEFRIVKVDPDWFEAEVIEGTTIKPRKTMNFPGMNLAFASLVEKDIQNLSLAARHHVDFVGLSFVRNAHDVNTLRSELDRLKVNCKIISKIEHPQAIENFDEILSATDGIMVARGDLGVEYPLEEVPGLQKFMIKRCRAAGKPVIVATQMLETMIENPRPTRAEVSDVANAVFDGADAVMLSAESAAGKYPIKTIRTMGRIAAHVESTVESPELEIDWQSGGQTSAVVAAAHQLMQFSFHGACDIKAFVVLTQTGQTAEYLSRLRPSLPIIALSEDDKTLDQLKLSWGVVPLKYDYTKQKQTDIAKILEYVSQHAEVNHGDKVIMIYGEKWGSPGHTSVIRVQEVV